MLNLLELYYQTQKGLTFTGKVDADNFSILCSTEIDDIYRNFAVVSNVVSVLSILDELKQKFQEINRKPCIYINSAESHELRDLQDNKWKIMFMDTWMRYEGVEIPMVHPVEKVKTPQQEKKFIEVFEKFYKGNIANLEQKIPDIFQKALAHESLKHYIAYHGDIPVAISSLCQYKGHCLVYNFACNPDYSEKGYRQSVLAACIDEMKKNGSNSLNVKISNSSNYERWFTQNGFRKTISAYGLTE